MFLLSTVNVLLYYVESALGHSWFGVRNRNIIHIKTVFGFLCNGFQFGRARFPTT